MVVSSPNTLPLLQGQLHNEGILTGNIVQSVARAGLMQRDSWWTRGSVTSRIALQEANEDSRFFLSIMEATRNPFKLVHRAIHYVKLKVSEQIVYVNIDSISKRLLLSKNEIDQAAKEGNLEIVIKDRIDFLSQNKKLLEQFEFESGEYSLSGPLRLKDTHQKVDSPINHILQKMYRIGNEIRLWEGNDAWKIIFLYKKNEMIAQGNFSKVYRGSLVFPNGQSTAIAVKVAKIHLQTSEEDIQFDNTADHVNALNQQRTLEHLDKFHLSEFVQIPHRLIKVIKDPRNVITHVFTIGDFIPGGTVANLFAQNIPLTRAIRLNINLLTMFKNYCIQGQVYHGDLKPENILLDEQGRPKLSDFGGSTILSESSFKLTSASFDLIKMYTPEYFPDSPQYIQARKAGLKALGNYNQAVQASRNDPNPDTKYADEQYEIALKSRNALHDAAKQMDFDTLTMIIAEVTAGKRKPKNELSVINFLNSLARFEENIIPQPLYDLLVKMSKMKIASINIDDLIEEWQKLLPESGV